MYFIRLFKKILCKHEYHVLREFKMDTDISVGYKPQDMYVMYCPKCKNEIIVTKDQGETMIERRNVDEEYSNYKEELHQLHKLEKEQRAEREKRRR